MSGTWSGFSEDDINKLKSKNETPEDLGNNRKLIKAKRRTNNTNNNLRLNYNLKTTEKIPEGAKLSKNELNSQNLNDQNLTAQNQPVAPEVLTGTSENLHVLNECLNNSITLDTCKIEKKVIDLDEFQARQKHIEEQNRRRKELLAKALADRTKQTEEEARRLKEIQNEFKKLDALLSNDVAILRHQIELASLDFMEAQKKYNKAEREFLDAKLHLHQKLEKKEMLTEHLCAIIEKNEERKAEKLNELMARLTVGDKTLNEVSENQAKKNPELTETIEKEPVDGNTPQNN